MSNKEIEDQIAKEYNKFYTSVYDGEVPVPAGVIELFKKALFAMPPALHQIHSDKMRELISMKENELTWVYVGKVVNTIMQVAPNDIYDSIEESINKISELEVFQIYFNNTVAAMDKKMDKKRKVLSEIAGAHKEPLKLIKAEA